MDSAIEFITAAAQVAEDRGVKSFLFDMRAALNAKSPLHDYQIANHHLRGLGFGARSRVALLVSPGDDSHDFFELTAGNAGHQWRVFDDEKKATEWLGVNGNRDISRYAAGLMV
jgi:hypothetical protein